MNFTCIVTITVTVNNSISIIILNRNKAAVSRYQTGGRPTNQVARYQKTADGNRCWQPLKTVKEVYEGARGFGRKDDM